jgi:hypothetical protein
VTDEQVKLPISAAWREGSCFHVRTEGTDVVVDVTHDDDIANVPSSPSSSLYEQVA